MCDEKLTIIGYHGTSSEKANNILKSGFTYRKVKLSDIKNEIMPKFPCDLGNGIYFYTDADEKGFDGLKNSCNYVVATKRNESEYSIIEACIAIDCNTDQILNLNKESVINKFILMRDQFSLKLDGLINSNKKINHYPDEDKSRVRGNCDGIFIELFIEKLGFDPVLVIKDTFSKFDVDYKISSFPNGREVSVRKDSIICSKEICKTFKRDN